MTNSDITRRPIENRKSVLTVLNFPGGGGLVYCVASAPDTSKDLPGQTQDVLDVLDGLLQAGGTDRSRIVKAEIVVTDHDRKAEFDAIWSQWVPLDCGPVRSFVQSIMPAGDQVEVILTAALPTD
jgi:enamine deaminase RidA (YjgF/YER057c/UK114 family)